MRVSVFVAAFALCAVSVAAYAGPVRYSLTGNMSGSLGADTFTNAAVTLTFLADTTNIDSTFSALGYFTNNVGTGTVTVAGLGTATFLSSTFGVEGYGSGPGYGNGGGGFFDSNFNVGILDPNLDDYDLSAPFTDTSYFVDGSFLSPTTGPESTSLGDLIITGGDDQNATTTFTASAVGGVVPEPSSFMLLGTGLVGLIGAARRRFA